MCPSRRLIDLSVFRYAMITSVLRLASKILSVLVFPTEEFACGHIGRWWVTSLERRDGLDFVISDSNVISPSLNLGKARFTLVVAKVG